jgi:uncharacterized membrane protein
VIIRTLIIILSFAGLANALYFTFAYYGRIKKARWVPEILCAREGSSCVTVVQTPYARVFGVPNSLLGIIYYLLLIVSVFKEWWIPLDVPFNGTYYAMGNSFQLLTVASAITLLLGFYLIYALRRKLHTHCPLCYLGHAINATLLVLLLLIIW